MSKSLPTDSSPVFVGPPRSRVLGRLRQWIDEGRLLVIPSENSLATELQVSRTTIRAALRQLEEEGVIRSGDGGRVAARPPTETRRSVLGDSVVVLSLPTDAPASSSGQMGLESVIQSGVIGRLGMEGTHVLSICSDRLDSEAAGRLAREHPRGVVALREAIESESGRTILAAMHDAGVPVVAYGDLPMLAKFDTLVSDHEAGAYLLTRWLIGKGRRKIVRFWQRNRLDGPRPEWLARRDAGYERAMREAGLTLLPAVECFALPPAPLSKARFDMEVQLTAGQLIGSLTGADPADSIMCISDGVYGAVAGGVRLLGKLPNVQVPIVAYDHCWRELPRSQWEGTAPAATIDKNNFKIGEQLAELLIRRMSHTLPPEPQHLMVEPTLVQEPEDGAT